MDNSRDPSAMQAFLDICLGRDRPPEATTIPRFDTPVPKSDRKAQSGRLNVADRERLSGKAGTRVRAGTIADAAVI